jgi:starch synthase (maltosyl-transferring)
VWDWDRAGHIKEDIRVLNRFRRENPALQQFLNLRFLACDSADILSYAKMTADRTNIVVVAVNLDPHAVHEGVVELPLDDFGMNADAEFALDEAFTRRVVACRGMRLRVRLDPQSNPASVYRLLPAPVA